MQNFKHFIKKIFLLLLLIVITGKTVLAAEFPRWIAQPIYVYIEEQGYYTTMMKKAFKAWEELSDSLVRFRFVSKPSSGKIKVYFVDRVTMCRDRNAVGCTRWTRVGKNYYRMTVEVATKEIGSDNQYRPVKNIYGVMLHEAGHALGLDHSDNPKSIMYPYDLRTMQYLTKDDLDLLYKKYH